MQKNLLKTFLKTFGQSPFLKISCIGLLALASCQQENSPEKAKADSIAAATGSSIPKDDEESLKQQGMKDPQTSDAFNPDVLQSYLPEIIKSYRGTPASTGNQFREGYSWTQVSRSYNIPTGDLRVEINDYADIGDFITTKTTQIQKPLAREGEEVKKLTPGNGVIAYESWHSGLHNGRLEALVANRFYIDITATNLPAEFTSLADVLKEINTTRLAQFPAKK